MADARSPVREVMSRGAISVDEKLTLRSLAVVLTELDVGVAIVARPDGSAGVVSERDVAHAISEGADPDEVWAADVMVDDLVLAEPEETVLEVADRMSAESVRHVAVVDRGKIVGVVSARDLLSVLADDARARL
jgi:predicted transcriptional regulator